MAVSILKNVPAMQKVGGLTHRTFRQRSSVYAAIVPSFFGRGRCCFVLCGTGRYIKAKSFAGLFGAAPSVAIATLSLTLFARGRGYAATEARSMICGAAAFFVYAVVVCRLMKKYQ